MNHPILLWALLMVPVLACCAWSYATDNRLDIYGPDGSVYLTRWWLASLLGYRIMLHKMHRPDLDRCLHDHPWGFVSVVLAGGYVEEVQRIFEQDDIRLETRRTWFNRPGAILVRPATWTHRIHALPNGTCWTLVFRGRTERAWGFHTDRGWVFWKGVPQAGRRMVRRAHAGEGGVAGVCGV